MFSLAYACQRGPAMRLRKATSTMTQFSSVRGLCAKDAHGAWQQWMRTAGATHTGKLAFVFDDVQVWSGLPPTVHSPSRLSLPPKPSRTQQQYRRYRCTGVIIYRYCNLQYLAICKVSVVRLQLCAWGIGGSAAGATVVACAWCACMERGLQHYKVAQIGEETESRRGTGARMARGGAHGARCSSGSTWMTNAGHLHRQDSAVETHSINITDRR